MCFLNIKACQHILLHQIMIFKKALYDPFNRMLVQNDLVYNNALKTLLIEVFS